MDEVVERRGKSLYPDLAAAFAKAGVAVASLFGCWHRQLSRPFTRDGETYRACLACGARRRFDTGRWETVGGYYYPPRPS
jgi:hypothetical protein